MSEFGLQNFDLLQNVLAESGLENMFTLDVDDDVYMTPSLKPLQPKLLSNKAKSDHHSRVKDRLKEKILAKNGSIKVKHEPVLTYKTALPRSLSHVGNKALEAESAIPNFDVLSQQMKSPESVMSPGSVYSMDVEMFSPPPASVMAQEVFDDAHPIRGQADLADQQYDLSSFACSLIDDFQPIDSPYVETHGHGHGLMDDSSDPVMSFEKTSAEASIDLEIRELKVDAIERELKREGEQHCKLPFEANTSFTSPEEGSFMDELVNALLPPTEQGGQLEMPDGNKIHTMGGDIYSPYGNVQESLLFDDFGNYARKTLPPLPSVHTIFPLNHAQPPPQPPPVKIEIRLEGRCYPFNVHIGTKVRDVMDQFKYESKIEDDFFFLDANFAEVKPDLLIDKAGAYKFQVTVLPKPAKPPRRRPPKSFY